MTIHVNIGEAKTRLSELVAAAVRGEEVILDKAGEPQVRLAPVAGATSAEHERRAAKRLAAFGMWRDRVGDRDLDVRRIKLEDEDLQQAYRRKYGAAD